MQFLIKPRISDAGSLLELFSSFKVGREDLVISNEYVLSPALQGNPLPCDVLYQEKFGSGEPTEGMINPMLSEINKKPYKRILAIGGGTIIDIAKLFIFQDCTSVSAMFKNSGSLKKVRELIIVPTTCGTGSEVTCISIVGFEELKTKAGLSLPAMFADEVVLIESLLATLPYPVFATSSIDALIHGLESYISPKANEFTKLFGKAAIGKIIRGYQEVIARNDKKHIANIKDFLLASTFAGIAFGNAGVGAVHALSYPLGGTYHVPHGKANYMVFPHVFSMYKQKGANLDELEAILSDVLSCKKAEAWTKLSQLIEKILPNEPISVLGITEGMCPSIARGVLETQQRLLANNPVDLSIEDITHIYQDCL